MQTAGPPHWISAGKFQPYMNSRLQSERRRAIGMQGKVRLGVCFIALSLGIGFLISVDFLRGPRLGCIMNRAAETADEIRAAFGRYAANSEGNRYPPTSAIMHYDDLVRIVNSNGGSLPAQEPAGETMVEKAGRRMQRIIQGCWDSECPPGHLTFVKYNSDESDEIYTLTLKVLEAPDSVVKGAILWVTPAGVAPSMGVER